MNFGIGAYAKGFMGLLRAARSGVGLRECSDTIVPTIDVRQQLGADARQFLVSSNLTPINNGNNTLGIQVPVGKTWLVLGGSLAVATAAGSQINQGVLVINPTERNGNVSLIVTEAIRPLVGAGADGTSSLWGFPGLLLGPGTELLLLASGIVVAAGVTANTRLYVEEYPS